MARLTANITAAVSSETREAIDKFAYENRLTPSEAIRQLLEKGLKAEETENE